MVNLRVLARGEIRCFPVSRLIFREIRNVIRNKPMFFSRKIGCFSDDFNVNLLRKSHDLVINTSALYVGIFSILYIIICFISIYIGSKNFFQLGLLKPFYFLSILSILKELFTAYTSLSDINSYYFESRNGFVIVEFFVLLNFFWNALNNLKIKSIVAVIRIIAIVYLLGCIVVNRGIIFDYSIFSVSESLIFLVLCIFLFVQFLQSEETDSLLRQPTFLVTSAIFLLSGISAPTYLLYDEFSRIFPEQRLLDLITIVGYILYIVLITFSFKWTTEKFSY